MAFYRRMGQLFNLILYKNDFPYCPLLLGAVAFEKNLDMWLKFTQRLSIKAIDQLREN